MFWAGLAVSAVITVGYLALSATIARRVLLVGGQWRSNPLALATAGIFFSCGVGHGVHAVHLLEHPDIVALRDPHVVLWDLTTAAVAVWYWSIRRLLTSLGGSGQLFHDATTQERARLAEVLHELFDGVELLPSGARDAAPLPEDLRRPEVDALVRRVNEDGDTRSLEVRTVADRVLEVRASRWTDQVVVAWRDVTDLRDAQQARAAVEARLAAAFDAAPVAMAVVSGDRVVQGNRALERLTGPGAPQEAAFASLLDAADRAAAAERLEAVRDGRGTGPWEARLVGRGELEGGRVEISLAAVQDEDGDQVVVHLVEVEQRKAYEARLQHLADHDPLTGLVNRRRFDRELERQCAQVARGDVRGALLLLDLDHFKEVNDTLGHAAGDRLIEGVAQVLRREVRAGDVVARLGGDEFAVLSTSAGAAEALVLADRLCEAVREHARSLGGSTVALGRVTCSIGVAVCGEGDTPQGLLVAADLTLYDAKEAGRDRFAVYSDDEHAQPRTKSRMQWLDRLRQALDDDDLVVLAQPVVDLATRETDHVELLLRLRDPDGSLVPPSHFLYTAEQSDLISEVDVRMVRTGVAHASRNPGLGVCVNVSGRSVSDPAVVERLVAEVRRGGLAAGSVVVEITETAAVASVAAAREGLLRLQGVGCRIALDDFGAGFGSLAYVKHLPFDILKIDGQFVEGCSSDLDDLVVVDAVVSLARGLGKTVVAEHVGDEETARLLLAHGVQHGQGFHLGVPEPLAVLVPQPRRPRGALAEVV